MELPFLVRFLVAAIGVAAYIASPKIGRAIRKRQTARGRRLTKSKHSFSPSAKNGLRWGNSTLPFSSAVRHFLVVGTTGSGKSIVQRLLMKGPLQRIKARSDQRALIFDAKGDTECFLKEVDIICPVFNLNPFADSKRVFAWDIAKDITSSARAQNLASSLLPSEKSGNNQYFTDAARQVLIGVIESLIVHSPNRWLFSDLVYISLNKERIRQVLSRDANGSDVLGSFFGDERTAYQVFTTIVSRMAYYKPVAAIWQRQANKISIREWLASSSILILGSNATVKTSLDAINQQMFRVLVEEIDIQKNSDSRRTWIWIDEARLAGSLLHKDLIPYLAVKGRSRGAALVLAFQDIDGFKEATGERLANEIVSQCSHKALLRMESELSASWASKTIGQYESIEVSHSLSGPNSKSNSSEQRVKKDAVLPSEFFSIPETNRRNGLSGYFISPTTGAAMHKVESSEISKVMFDPRITNTVSQKSNEDQQWLIEWGSHDFERLGLEAERVVEKNNGASRSPKKAKLVLKTSRIACNVRNQLSHRENNTSEHRF